MFDDKCHRDSNHRHRRIHEPVLHSRVIFPTLQKVEARACGDGRLYCWLNSLDGSYSIKLGIVARPIDDR